MNRTLLLGLAMVFIAGCGLSAAPHQLSTGEEAGDPAPVSTAADVGESIPDKVSVPVDVDLLVEAQQLVVGTDVPVTFHFLPRQAVQYGKSQIVASGVVTLTAAANHSWQNLAANQDVQTRTTVQVTGLGAGEIRGTVQVLDGSGQPLYGRTATIYVLSTDVGILTGTASPSQLQHEYLELARAAGKLSQAEYEKALEQLLYGGATETTDIVTPTP